MRTCFALGLRVYGPNHGCRLQTILELLAVENDIILVEKAQSILIHTILRYMLT